MEPQRPACTTRAAKQGRVLLWAGRVPVPTGGAGDAPGETVRALRGGWLHAFPKPNNDIGTLSLPSAQWRKAKQKHEVMVETRLVPAEDFRLISKFSTMTSIDSRSG